MEGIQNKQVIGCIHAQNEQTKWWWWWVIIMSDEWWEREKEEETKINSNSIHWEWHTSDLRRNLCNDLNIRAYDVPVQLVLYRLCEQRIIKNVLPEQQNKEETWCLQWSSYIIELLFSTKLNEWCLKRKPRRLYFFTLGGTWLPICLKKSRWSYKKQSKIWKSCLYKGNSYNKIEIQLC